MAQRASGHKGKSTTGKSDLVLPRLVSQRVPTAPQGRQSNLRPPVKPKSVQRGRPVSVAAGRLLPLRTLPGPVRSVVPQVTQDDIVAGKRVLDVIPSVDEALGRLGRKADVATARLLDALAPCVEQVSCGVARMKQAFEVFRKSVDKRLEEDWEELDANLKMLEGLERQLRVGHHPSIPNTDLGDGFDVDDSIQTAQCTLTALDALLPPTCCSLVTVPHWLKANEALVRSTHLQLGVDVSCSSVSHPEWLQEGEAGVVSVLCRDSQSDTVACLNAADVAIAVAGPHPGWTFEGLRVTEGSVSVLVTVTSGSALKEATLTLQVSATVFTIPLQAARSIIGRHCRTLTFRTALLNNGMAISPDGSLLAVTHQTSAISTCRLPEGTGWRTRSAPIVCGASQPWKVCISPLTGRLLLADEHRIVERSLDGACVREIGVGLIDGKVCGVAANADIIVAGTNGITRQICVFNAVTGDYITSFGEKGRMPGQLENSLGLRITPDGQRLLIAEYFNDRVSVWSVQGAFHYCFGVGVLKSPYDVEIAPNGDFLVADGGNHRICVFGGVGGRLLRTFGGRGVAPGKFQLPHSLAMRCGQLYILDDSQNSATRVQVFE